MKSHALKVAAGILSSRLLGFVRSALQARYLGVGAHADVLSATFRVPNLLQNLLGEQSLSAAFIPIYSRMLEEGREEDAGRFAGAVFGLLTAVAGGLALVGVVFARPIVAVFSTGFLRDVENAAVDRYELAVQGVQILFPMAAVLVLSAWCLGVLNSHRRFLLPYMAPVAWNAAIIAAFVYFGQSLAAGGEGIPPAEKSRLYFAVCWGALAGGVLQFLVQLPSVLRLLRGFRPSLSRRVEGVREALAAFGPVVAGRGVVNLSGYLDLWLATCFAAGAVSILDYVARLYLLPIALFGLSVAAAELPELARLEAEAGERRLRRIEGGLRQVAFLAVPTVVGYLAFGYLVVGAIYRRGEFGAQSHWLGYGMLCLFTLGLLPTTLSRLLTNAFYAGGDTKTPAKIAVGRMLAGVAVAAPAMWYLDRFTLSPWLEAEGAELHLGALGLGLGSAIAAWLEIGLLRRRLRARIEGFRIAVAPIVRMVGLAFVAALPAAGLWWWLDGLRLILLAPLVVGLYAAAYLGLAFALDLPEGRAWLRLGRREG